MKIFPSLNEIKDIAQEQKYDIVPVSCEILSDFTTPIEAMKVLKNVSAHCYMLESAQANDRWATPLWALTQNWRSPVLTER